MSVVLTDINAMEVVSLEQAHEVAWIRNQCRGRFTHHNEHITPEQQKLWWESRPDVRMWLYAQADSAITRWVGFGLLRRDEHGHLWATLAVLPGLRGQGYGTAIYRHLIEQGGHVWIEIGEGNAASYRAARKAGFVTVDVKGKVLTLVAGKASE
jgi:GNAT superfamily N-acetyltransferase